MKKVFILFTLCLLSLSTFAQKKSYGETEFSLGNGLTIRLNDGDYVFNMGGFIQSGMQFYKNEGERIQNRSDIKYGFFNFSGDAVKEKLSFILQVDFAQPSAPLMEAWLAYKPSEYLTITAGQKQTFVNNREMTFFESKLSMVDRSVLSRYFSNTGREFGLFLEGRFMIKEIGILPQAAITSGDGRNSFGVSSTDVDKGGLKWGGRLDICPLGFFTYGNDKIGADLAHEKSPKIKFGVAGSYNRGASEYVGEGHGIFTLYDQNGQQRFPDYRQVYVDLMVKYKGFSFLTEYVNATGTNIKGLFTSTNGAGALRPGQISSFLNLGNAYNFQVGYALTSGYAFDLRYSNIFPEFNEEISALKGLHSYDATFTKYFTDNRFKLQAGFSYLDYKSSAITNKIMTEFLFQIIF